MSSNDRDFEPEATPDGSPQPAGARVQEEEGRKGGMVMAPSAPVFAPGVRTLERTEARETADETRTVHWGAALLAGAAAGVLLLAAQMVLTAVLLDTSVWASVRVMASVVIGERALEPPLTYDPGMTMAALLVHFLVCAAFAVALAPLLRWFDRGPAALIGAAYGLLTYNLVFYAAAMVRPTLVYGRGMASIVSHLLFGIALAVLYRTFAGAPEAPIPEPPHPERSRSETVNVG